MSGDPGLHATLAVEHALTEADRQRILARFHHTGLDGADVSDILDILSNQDALLELREPFYEGGGFEEARQALGWFDADADADVLSYTARLRLGLIGHSVLAVALLTGQVPTPGQVARLATKAAEAAEQRWPGGEYV